MKKIVIGACIALSTLCLVACGESDEVGEASVEIVEEVEPTAEVVEEEEPVYDEDKFLEEVKSAAKWHMMPREDVLLVKLKDRELILKVSYTKNNVTLERFKNITTAIIEIKDGYDFWDSITISSSNGSITKTKDDIVGKSFAVSEDDIVK